MKNFLTLFSLFILISCVQDSPNVQQIGNITQADIAASDDITGEGGDWLLEVERGIIEAKNLEVNHYNSSLVTLTGVTSSSGFVVESGTNLRAGQSAANTASSASAHSDGNQPYVIAYEREITSGTYTSYNQSITATGFEESNSGVDSAGPDISQNRTSFTASSSAPKILDSNSFNSSVIYLSAFTNVCFLIQCSGTLSLCVFLTSM